MVMKFFYQSEKFWKNFFCLKCPEIRGRMLFRGECYLGTNAISTKKTFFLAQSGQLAFLSHPRFLKREWACKCRAHYFAWPVFTFQMQNGFIILAFRTIERFVSYITRSSIWPGCQKSAPGFFNPFPVASRWYGNGILPKKAMLSHCLLPMQHAWMVFLQWKKY